MRSCRPWPTRSGSARGRERPGPDLWALPDRQRDLRRPAGPRLRPEPDAAAAVDGGQLLLLRAEQPGPRPRHAGVSRRRPVGLAAGDDRRGPGRAALRLRLGNAMSPAPEVALFVAGAMSAGFAIAGLFFLRFW